MDSAQRVNSAPALYAAAVAILAYGVAFAATFNLGGDSPAGNVAMIVSLVSIVSATVAVAVGSKDFRPIWAIIAIGGTVIALDVSLAIGVAALNFPSNNSDNIGAGAITAAGIGFVILTAVAGLVGVGALATCRRYFANTNPYLVSMLVIVVNAIVVSISSAFSGLSPDVEFRISDRIYPVTVDGGVLYGLGDDIGNAVGFTAILFTLFPVAFIAGVTFISATALLRRHDNEGIARAVSVTAIGISVVATVIAVLAATISVVDSVGDANAHHASWGRDLDVASAIVAGIVALLGCAVVAGLAGVVAWWFQSLRGGR
jgi:hypothetical protein